MTLQRAIAALLISTGVFGGVPNPDLDKPIYMPEVLEQPAALGELVFDDVAETECKSNSTRCDRRTRKHRPFRKVFKHKPVKKLLSKLRGK